jgi:hypothetical protein
MRKNAVFQQPSLQVSKTEADRLVYAIALAMARRQMQEQWPRR